MQGKIFFKNFAVSPPYEVAFQSFVSLITNQQNPPERG